MVFKKTSQDSDDDSNITNESAGATRVILESPPAATSSDLSLDVMRVGVPFENRIQIIHFVSCCCCCVLITWLALSKSQTAHKESMSFGPDEKNYSPGARLRLA